MKLVAIALIGVALVLAAAPFGQAAVVHGGPGFTGHRPIGHFDGHRFDGHHVFADHRFDRRFHGSVIIGAPFYWPPVYPYYDPPAYEAPPASYWYYCRSAGAYYPTVQSCAEAWVPVPAQ